MKRNDNMNDGAVGDAAEGLPEEWEGTPRHPEFPDGDLQVCETEQGIIIYDSDNPGRYVGGRGVELGG